MHDPVTTPQPTGGGSTPPGYRGSTAADRTLDERAPSASDAELSDDGLAALAMAADPDAPVDDDALPRWELVGDAADRYLPESSRPFAMGGRVLRGWRRLVIVLIIVSFLVIDAYGLCNTSGLVRFG